MKIYNLKNYEIVAPETMLVGITNDGSKMVVVNEIEREVHCIIEIKDGKLLLNNGWDANYIIDGNKITLDYIFEKEYIE